MSIAAVVQQHLKLHVLSLICRNETAFTVRGGEMLITQFSKCL